MFEHLYLKLCCPWNSSANIHYKCTHIPTVYCKHPDMALKGPYHTLGLMQHQAQHS